MMSIDKANVKKGKKHILIVDDEPMNVFLLTQVLKSYDFKLTVAVNGKEAIDKFKKGSYDLILMDLNMPVIDGYEASRSIRKISSMPPIIVISAVKINVEQLKQDIGINYFLSKPINVKALRDLVEALLPTER